MIPVSGCPLEFSTRTDTLATQSWISTYTDCAELKAIGVWGILSFADANSWSKIYTRCLSNWISYVYGPMVHRENASSRQTLPIMLTNPSYLGITTIPGTGLQTISPPMYYSEFLPSGHGRRLPCWYMEHRPPGIRNFNSKLSTTGNIYIDEIQIINSAPTLVDANRGNTPLHYAYGDFDDPSETTGWGQESMQVRQSLR